jgi:hypothetical protein
MLAMRVMTFASSLVATAFFLFSTLVYAVGPDPARDWRSAETAHFRLHFEARHRAQAQYVAALAERIHLRVTRWLDWIPNSKTEVVIADFTDQANGFASPLPYNTVYLFLAPPDDGELLQNDEWLKLVFTHEYIHIVHLDKASGTPLGLRSVFGRFPFLFPNLLQPTWLVEGLAVYGESSPAEKLGRLKNSQFEALLRVEAEKGFLTLREVNADGRALPLNRAYLYGAYFYDFLAERYGEGAILGLVAGYSDNLLPFRVLSNPEAVTGKPMDVLWEEFLAYLRHRLAAQRAALQVFPASQGERVLTAPDIGALAQGPDGSLYAVRYDGLTSARLVRRSPGGALESIAQVARNARIDVSVNGQVLIVQPEVYGEHDYFNDLYLLREGILSNLERLTHGGRMREVVWLREGESGRGGGFAALRRDANGASSLWQLAANGEPLVELYRAAPDEALLGLAAHPKQQALVFVSLQRGVWRVIEWTPAGTKVLLADSAVKSSPRYASDGEALLLLADYDHVPNLWQLRKGGDQAYELSLLTHTHTAITGLSGTARNKGIYLTTVVAEGDAVHQLGEPFVPIITRVQTPSAELAKPISETSAQPASLLREERSYSAWPSLLPHSWFPLLQAADGAVIIGAFVFGADVLGVHQYVATPMVELTQGEALGAFSYLYDQRFALSASRQLEVEATTGGQRKEIAAYIVDDHLQALALLPHTRREWRVFAGLGAALDRSRLKVVGGDALRFQDEQLAGLVVGYDSRRVEWLSEGPSQGLSLMLVAEQGMRQSEFPGRAWHLSAGAFLPVGNTVLAARWRAGRADEDAEPFSVGGIAFVPDLPRLNQRRFGLRGYDGGAQRGRRMRLGTLEWRLPLADIDRHLMLPPAGINRLSATLFIEAGSAWSGEAAPKDLRSRGVELLGEIKLGYRLPLDTRLGYVEALDQPRDKRLYLTLGRAF